MVASKVRIDKKNAGTIFGSKYTSKCNSTNNIFFADGTVLCYPVDIGSKGRNRTIHAYIDTNGTKAPNKPFECTSANCSPDGKTIGDQFPITLYGNTAIPGHVAYNNGVSSDDGTASENNAARWALNYK